MASDDKKVYIPKTPKGYKIKSFKVTVTYIEDKKAPAKKTKRQA